MTAMLVAHKSELLIKRADETTTNSMALAFIPSLMKIGHF
jgi:hypothetical protein